MPSNLICSLNHEYIYWNDTQYPISMSNYCVSFKIKHTGCQDGSEGNKSSCSSGLMTSFQSLDLNWKEKNFSPSCPHLNTCFPISLSVCIHIYTYICACVCVCIHTYNLKEEAKWGTWDMCVTPASRRIASSFLSVVWQSVIIIQPRLAWNSWSSCILDYRHMPQLRIF